MVVKRKLREEMTQHYFIGYAHFAEACYVDEETVDVVNGSHKD